MLAEDELIKFRHALLDWFSSQQRDLPWRRSRDPYAIWISEVMLQQTRVVAAIPYYERFLARFPSFKTLAQATEQEVLACWSGLGYYYRAGNLQKAAKQMLQVGSFPSTYKAIRELPGVGDYTAAAIASISFGLSHAVVDGNVLRVLSRLFADPANIGSTNGKQHFIEIANALLDRKHPGAFNQAVMELGAIVCLPRNPRCLVCPVAEWCHARKTGAQSDFPVKIGPRQPVREERMLFWVERHNQILAWQRPATSKLMPGFWELPERDQLPNALPIGKLGSFRHTITFHNYVFELWNASLATNTSACSWIDLSDPLHLPMSTVLKKGIRVVKGAEWGRETARIADTST